ncbi:M10 family metallopeptidase C-terminal domain-containing protein [Pseudomonas paralactis]|uniref:M10 family metallopeptidase C-terminal domain-containing protein n=1 Tax=Pseudomonas paralactis TaxID=1615673 RepID=UPI0034D5683A
MINLNAPVLNLQVANHVAQQSLPAALPGNNEASSAHNHEHSTIGLTPSKHSILLNVSEQVPGELTTQPRFFGSSAHLGASPRLLQLGEVATSTLSFSFVSGFGTHVLKCETKPQGDHPKANVDKTPKDEPKANVDKTPKDEPNAGVDKTPKDQPNAGVDKTPKSEPKVGVDKAPKDEPNAGVAKTPKDEPNAGVAKTPKDEPNAGVDKAPKAEPKVVADKAPKAEPKVVVDKTPKAEPKVVVDKAPKAEPKVVADKAPKDETKPGRNSNSDDTVYGFNSNTGKPEMTLTSASDKPDFTVWDDRGNDTFDFSGFKQDQSIDLRGGSRSSVGGMKENVRIAEKTVIENAIGGQGNDRIIGNSADNVLIGGGGSDTLVGGGGWNTFKFNAFTDSSRTNADLLVDFNTGQDKIDLSQMAIDGKVAFNFVDSYSGKAGDTIIKFNPQSGRYLLAIDLDGDGKTDFLIKSTRMISPEDVIGLNIKDDGYL